MRHSVEHKVDHKQERLYTAHTAIAQDYCYSVGAVWRMSLKLINLFSVTIASWCHHYKSLKLLSLGHSE